MAYLPGSDSAYFQPRCYLSSILHFLSQGTGWLPYNRIESALRGPPLTQIKYILLQVSVMNK